MSITTIPVTVTVVAMAESPTGFAWQFDLTMPTVPIGTMVTYSGGGFYAVQLVDAAMAAVFSGMQFSAFAWAAGTIQLVAYLDQVWHIDVTVPGPPASATDVWTGPQTVNLITADTPAPPTPTPGAGGQGRGFDYVTVTLETVTSTTDAYGDTTETVSTTDIPGCLFAPRSSSERTDPSTPAVIDGGSVYMPYGVPSIGSVDRLLINGEAWSVEGIPGVWGTAGVEVAVKRWEQP